MSGRANFVRLGMVCCIGLLGMSAPCLASVFEFDLTESIGSDFSTLESIVELGVEFRSIDGASIHLRGDFTPGLVTLVTIPPESGPIVPSDTVNLIVRMGEEGSAWIDKNVYAIQSLVGSSGAVDFSLPLRGAVTTIHPTLFPHGDLPPDFGFLLDGRFGLSATRFSWLAALYAEVEPPRFELTRFVLAIEGTPVPEPATGALLALAFVGVAVSIRRR